MNKQDLVEAVQKALGSTKKDAELAVNTVFETISKALSKGKSVSVFGFGIFEAKKRKARTVRNPRTGETIKIPAMRVPRFRAAKALKDSVK